MARKKGSGKPKPLTASELSWACPLKDLPFRTTKDLEPLRRIVGQDRAMEALRLGARIRSQGYNIWTSGVVGTGRMTTIRRILDEVKVDKPDLNDFAYVNNFRDPSMPVLLRFAAGEGRVFCTMMEDALSVLKRRIPSLFEEDQFQVERKKIIHRYQAQEDTLLKDFDAKLRPVGFVLGHVQEEDGSTRTEIFPFIDGQPLTMEELEEQAMEGKIEEEQVEQLRERYVRYREEFNELGHRTLRMASEFRKELGKHDRAAVGSLINTVLEDVRASFPRDRVRLYLDGVKEHILSNLEEYVRIQAGRLAQTIDDASEERGKELDQKYSVNLIIDNYDQKVAPVIVETSPTYTSLFGTIEKKMDSRGYVVSDFSQIRAGSLLRADGGFIIMNAMDVLTDGRIWTALKRLMLYHRLEITSSDSQFQLNQLQPDHVNVNVKIILLGDPSIYHALWASEEDFHKTFKVHAEFDDHTKRTPEMIMNFARFFSQLAEDEALLHCDRSGVAALCEWAVAYTDSQERITLQFSYVADLMREASHFAGLAEARLISRRHVAHALAQRRWRSNSADERLREEITKGTLLIDVKGSRVGQINGLTIYQSGIVSYGKPSRITATVSAGDKGIINIEREVDLSGSIHSKGVLILSGLMRAIFSRSQPISFTASIAFEQSYGGVDGDSASAAETIALLSAIANIPIRQDLAITGSINQKGDIQPVGGVNEKITGFFEVCQDRGLTGSQGVVLPVQNVTDLMLRDDVIDAVRKRRFHLWPIRTLEEAVELMMSMPAGKPRADGMHPDGTVFSKVQSNLNVLHEASKRKSRD